MTHDVEAAIDLSNRVILLHPRLAASGGSGRAADRQMALGQALVDGQGGDFAAAGWWPLVDRRNRSAAYCAELDRPAGCWFIMTAPVASLE